MKFHWRRITRSFTVHKMCQLQSYVACSNVVGVSYVENQLNSFCDTQELVLSVALLDATIGKLAQ